MGLWFLINLHDESLRDSYGLAMQQLLASGGFATTIREGRLLERPEFITADNVAGLITAIYGCSAAMGGCIDTRPAAPWAGFVIAPDLGIARLQEFVEVAPMHGIRRPSDIHGTTAIARYHMVLRLFGNVAGLHAVVSPLSIAEAIRLDRKSRLHEAFVDDRFQVTIQR